VQRSQIFQAGKVKADENAGEYWGKCNQGGVLGHQKSLALDRSNAQVKVRNPAMSRGWRTSGFMGCETIFFKPGARVCDRSATRSNVASQEDCRSTQAPRIEGIAAAHRAALLPLRSSN